MSWQIKCPECNKSNGLIIEQPSWDNNHKTLYVEIDCHCIDCKLDFTIVSKLSTVKVTRKSKTKSDYHF